MDPNLLVEARSLGVSYGAKRALDGVSFTIPKGRVVGLLGHNGAGKTTLMKALVGLVKPAQGDLAVLGLDPLRDRVALLEQACYIPDVAILPRWARVNDLIGLMSGLHPRFSAERARALLRRTSVDPADKVKTLSKLTDSMKTLILLERQAFGIQGVFEDTEKPPPSPTEQQQVDAVMSKFAAVLAKKMGAVEVVQNDA